MFDLAREERYDLLSRAAYIRELMLSSDRQTRILLEEIASEYERLADISDRAGLTHVQPSP
jgi:hypothetical protein